MSELSREEVERIRRDYEATIPGDLHRLLAHVDALEKSLENARRERDESIRIGKQFHADARKHFDQSCTNLQRAETAERERDVAQAMLAEREGLLAGAQERLDNAYRGLQQAVAERDEALGAAARWEESFHNLNNGLSERLLAAERELDVAVADSLARTMVIRDMVDEGWWDHTEDDCPEDDTCECALLKRVNDAARLDGHPGAALLERMKRLRAFAADLGPEDSAALLAILERT